MRELIPVASSRRDIYVPEEEVEARKEKLFAIREAYAQKIGIDYADVILPNSELCKLPLDLPPRPLTDRQHEILCAAQRVASDDGTVTVASVAAELGVPWQNKSRVNAIHSIVAILRNRGYLRLRVIASPRTYGPRQTAP